MIRFFAKGRCAHCVTDDKLTKGSVGIEVRFYLEDWDAAPNRVAVFKAGSVKVDVALLSDSCTVPPEVLANPGDMLVIGVYGTDSGGDIVIPTVYADAGRVRLGAAPSGISPTPTTQPLIDQLVAAAEEAERIAQSVRDDADNGVFDGEDGVSPEVTITSITGGHRVTITDEEHPSGQSFDVMDGQGGSGSSDYDDLTNKPQINGVTLSGNKSLVDFGITPDVFYATYGTTTSAEVEAAYQAGKIVLVEYNSIVFFLAARTSATYHVFTVATSAGTGTVVLNNDAWSTSYKNIPSASNNTPQALGTATAGSAIDFSRADHVHPKPTASDIGAIAAPEGGSVGQVLKKTASGTEWANESGGGGLTDDIKQALLQLAQKVAYVDEHGADYYQDLYDALYPSASLVSISAAYTQSSTVYPSTQLDSLKTDLVVTGTYDDSSTATIPATDYTLSGTLTVGTSTVTVTSDGKTTTFTVTVTARPTLSSITAVYANESANIPITSSMKRQGYINTGGIWTAYAQSFSLAIPATVGKAYKLSWNETDEALVGNYFRWGFCDTDIPSSQTLTAWNRGWTPQNCNEITVIAVDDFLVVNVLNAVGDSVVSNGYLTVTEYDNCIQDLGTLDPLTSNLVVTATYAGGATEIIPSTDYTLSGTLNTGENTITVNYGGKTDTFTAIVAAPLYSIPDFSATTQGNLTVSKTSGVYSISGSGRGVAYINPDGTVSTSKSNTAWFSNTSGASLSNYVYGADWSNPLTSDTNLAVKFSQASATGNLYTANVAMAASSSGTNASAEFTRASLPVSVNISSIGFQFYPDPGSGSPSATFTLRLVINGVRYL